eukprot:TRINITY_DN43036_c0_g1_i1.p1 TRINITY_DN43036_c0_g1~~TRINITY_DN43036_c0_g1_i1.p1  ORF type:complete len:291 (+),score=49.96 TRINITY_DN43036_c0_g1_i1:81-953(+)
MATVGPRSLLEAQLMKYLAANAVQKPSAPVLPAKISLSNAMKLSLGKAMNAGQLSTLDVPDFVPSPWSSDAPGFVPTNFSADEPAFVSMCGPPPGLEDGVACTAKEEHESDGGSTDDAGSRSGFTAAESWLGDESDISSIPAMIPGPVCSYQALSAALSLGQQLSQQAYLPEPQPCKVAVTQPDQLESIDADVQVSAARRPCKKKRRNCVKIIDYLLASYQQDQALLTDIAAKLASESNYMRCLCLKYMIPIETETDLTKVELPQYIQDMWTHVSPIPDRSGFGCKETDS